MTHAELENEDVQECEKCAQTIDNDNTEVYCSECQCSACEYCCMAGEDGNLYCEECAEAKGLLS